MVHTSGEFTASKSGSIRWWLTLSAVIRVLGIAIVMSFGVGRWLLVEDKLEKAQAMLVLSGSI